MRLLGILFLLISIFVAYVLYQQHRGSIDDDVEYAHSLHATQTKEPLVRMHKFELSTIQGVHDSSSQVHIQIVAGNGSYDQRSGEFALRDGVHVLLSNCLNSSTGNSSS